MRARRGARACVATWVVATLLAACGGDQVRGSDTGPVSAAPTTPPIRDTGELREELVKGEGRSTPYTEEELRDLQQLSTYPGQDFATLKKRHRGGSDFSAVTSRYGFRYREIWVETGVGPVRGRGENYVVFTRRPPAKVFADLKALGTDTLVLWGAAGTSRELRRLSLAVMRSLTDREGVFSSAATGTARLGESVSVSYSLNPDASPEPTREQIEAWRAEALAAGAARFTDGRMPVPVEFREGAPGARDVEE